MKAKCLPIFATFIASAAAWAGGSDIGHGGNAVVCRGADGKIRSAEIADYYEARVVRGMAIDLGAAPDWATKIVTAVTRLERLDPARAGLLRARIGAFPGETRFVAGADFPLVPDNEGIVAPAGCKVEQVAIQKEPQFPEDHRYLVNQDIWDKFDAASKAGLVLHEIVYREALGFHATNSVGARYFNSLIASPSFEPITLGDYVKRLVASGLYSLEYATHLNHQPFRLHVPLGEYQEASPEIPGSGGWLTDIRVGNGWVVVKEDRSSGDFMGVLGKRFTTVFGSAMTREADSRADIYFLPAAQTQAGTEGFSLWLGGPESEHYQLSTGGEFGPDQADETLLQFNRDGALENEGPLPCGESFYALASFLFDKYGRTSAYDFGPSGTFRCAAEDGTSTMTSMKDGFLEISNPDDGQGPMINLLLNGVASLRWQIFGKTYLLQRKAKCGNNGENDLDPGSVRCNLEGRYCLIVNTAKRKLELAEQPKNSCLSLQEN